MELGVMWFPTDLSMPVIDLARALEERGFESLWVAEHTHTPVSRATPYPMSRGDGTLPEEYRRLFDPFVALAGAAAVTERLKVATGICLVAQHDTIDLAKSVASLDHQSNGRFIFGVGYGWNVEEMADHGVGFKERRAIVAEKLQAMKGLWTEEVAGFDGEHVRFEPSWMWPKPVQRPHPPIFFGGAGGPKMFRHIVEHGDGWIPIGGAALKNSVEELRRTAEEMGRDPATIQLNVFGSRGESVEKLDRFAELGVTRTVLSMPPNSGADKILPILDHYAETLLAPMAAR